MSLHKLIELPKLQVDPEINKDLCKCRPVCKGRRREWKGQIQQTSAELLAQRKPIDQCRRRKPAEFRYEGICPLLGRDRRVIIKKPHPPPVIHICTAPIDTSVDTTYLKAVELAKKLGVTTPPSADRCPVCSCCHCCGCCGRLKWYEPAEHEHGNRRRDNMRAFDQRVKRDAQSMSMKIMYD